MATIPHPVPTNVITGFLGSGKTTVIQHLLKSKPENERWAILVNEFGEVGIDGAILDGSTEQSVFIREVPGGCMCCTSGLPMQIALNQLLARAKPDRLLIEPTGLGHPREVLETLCEAHYRPVIDLQGTITLVDARKTSDPRYTDHATFKEQLFTADIIVASKCDLYDEGSLESLNAYLDSLGVTATEVIPVSHGELDFNLLSCPSKVSIETSDSHHHHHHADSAQGPSPADLIEQGQQCVRVTNKGSGYFSKGWIVSPDTTFDFKSIMTVLSGIESERMKGVFITDKGIFAINKADDVLSCVDMDESTDSRLEIICQSEEERDSISQVLEKALFSQFDE